MSSIKKSKLVKVLLPAMLLGSPILASSIRSNSRRVIKKAVTKSSENFKKKESFNDPFNVFGKSSFNYETKKEESDVLAFLEEEGLLSNEGTNKSIESGERKEFATLYNYNCASGATWNSKEITKVHGSTDVINVVYKIGGGVEITSSATPALWNSVKDACNTPASDTTAPTLSGLNSKNITTTTADINASSNEDGKIYYVVTSSATAPSVTQVRSGLDNTGASAIKSSNSAVTANTEKIFNLTGLSAGTGYHYHMVAADASENNSTVSSGNFTTSAPATDSDSTLTASATVNESSMISIPSTANTLAEKINVFDFTITDLGTADGVSTDVTKIVINTSGTADFTKIKWLLSGNDLTDINGSYSSNTITFSDLNISVADGGSETYTLSAYFKNPTGLTDNSTFGFSINGSNDIIVNTSGSTMATGQNAITNSTNAKVDITATRMIFKTMPSN